MILSSEENRKLIGAIVKRKGYEVGAGVIIEARKYYGEVQVKIGWFASPFIRFQPERKIGWHLFSSLFIISEPILGVSQRCL